MKSTFSDRLREALDLRRITAAELSRRTDIPQHMISKYLRGLNEAKSGNLHKFAVALEVSEAWLMGLDVPRTPSRPVETQKIPLLGEISCGQPSLANEEFEAYVNYGASIRCDFCLRAKGDSMIGARIQDGDIVFIRRQSVVQNGEIAAVIIGDEATLKRVFIFDDKLILQAENPKYPPLVFVKEELNTIRILGKAIAFQSDVK